MSRDWNATWERWRDMPEEERAAARAEMREDMRVVGAAFVAACDNAIEAIRKFRDSLAPMADEIQKAEQAEVDAMFDRR